MPIPQIIQPQETTKLAYRGQENWDITLVFGIYRLHINPKGVILYTRFQKVLDKSYNGCNNEGDIVLNVTPNTVYASCNENRVYFVGPTFGEYIYCMGNNVVIDKDVLKYNER